MPRTRDGSDSRRDSDDEVTRDPDRTAADRRDPQDSSGWFANTAFRAGLTIIGLILLLFALGQAFGLPLLDWTAEALSSQTGRWLVVALFALLLIALAQRGLAAE